MQNTKPTPAANPQPGNKGGKGSDGSRQIANDPKRTPSNGRGSNAKSDRSQSKSGTDKQASALKGHQ